MSYINGFVARVVDVIGEGAETVGIPTPSGSTVELSLVIVDEAGSFDERGTLGVLVTGSQRAYSEKSVIGQI